MTLFARIAASILTETISHSTHQEHEEDVCIMSSGTIHKRTWVHDGRTHTAYQFSIAVNGKQVRRQFATKAEAQIELDKFKDTLKRPTLKPMTLHEAIELYLKTKAEKRSLSGDRRALRVFEAAWGAETPLSEITSARIAEWQVANRGRAGGKWDNVTAISTATTNRPLACLRHLLRLAWRRWEVLTVVPHIELDREPEGRLRFLDEQEIVRLMSACANPERSPMLTGIVTVALNTGMRRGEILGLTWDRVDFARGVIVLTPEGTKSGKGREVPMTQTVNDLLAAMPQPHTGRVFPLVSIDESYRVALREAKIAGANFHTLRHTFASHFMQREGNLYDLAKILGHASVRITSRYAHLSPTHLRAQMGRMDGITGSPSPSSTRTAQEPVPIVKLAAVSRT
jgi:integrase